MSQKPFNTIDVIHVILSFMNDNDFHVERSSRDKQPSSNTTTRTRSSSGTRTGGSSPPPKPKGKVTPQDPKSVKPSTTTLLTPRLINKSWNEAIITCLPPATNILLLRGIVNIVCRSKVEGTPAYVKDRTRVALRDHVKTLLVQADALITKESQAIGPAVSAAATDLQEALPILNACTAALDCLTMSDIKEVKALARPPSLVAVVGEAVMLILDAPNPNEWKTFKEAISRADFLQRLFNVPRDSLDPKKMAKVATILTHATPSDVMKVCKAAAGLCQWCHGMVNYHNVVMAITPKKLVIDHLNASVDRATKTKEELLKLDKLFEQ